ncbi:hypothetical protein KIH74_10410 [Kineosporia sp. J2-2]|uniref:Uncharacterized protein n=1 Tax=Kineosporia corallincola TaxID=2835133 RepID=A0ABS5TG04_9ACTN|nr:hypothetical protein [Kineosporia corallincola]MBT0769334.1 hypothetical protein [Kineosporia corallincola]
MGEVSALRDRVEGIVRSWHAYELSRGAQAVIDYDCAPDRRPVPAARSRLDVYQQLTRCAGKAAEIGAGARDIRDAVRAHRAYAGALLGRRDPLHTYLRDTQGCDATDRPEEHIQSVRDRAVRAVEELGIGWGPDLNRQLLKSEEPLTPEEAAEQIPVIARELEPRTRALVGTRAPCTVRVEMVDVEDYWGYWLDGAGSQARLRFNRRHSSFTVVQVRQFAMHELLGHALQSASYAQVCADDPDVPWLRLLSVNLPYQMMLEGLAQTLPLFLAPDDAPLIARLRLTHYLQLVRAELHLAVNSGIPLMECANHARARVPWWTNATISDVLSERGADPLLRSYLWAYPAGVDWWVALADTADDETRNRVLRKAYQRPLTPAQLDELVTRPD